MIDALLLFWLMFKAALFSTSGSGNLPILHQDLLARGWATDRNFAESLAIGQISPGPSGLWVISLGYLLDGLRGALLTLVAITLPPLVVLAINGFYRRYGDHPALQGFVRGLSLAVSGCAGVSRLLIPRYASGFVTGDAAMAGVRRAVHWQQSDPQHAAASGLRARMKALANLSLTSGATESTSRPASLRKARASSTL